MLRSLSASISVFPVLVASVAVTSGALGCYGDMVSTREGVVTAGDDGPTGEPIPTELEFPCVDPVDTTDDGYHYEGSACLGCHNGSVGPEFSLGGTLYAGDGAALAGLNIHLLDADGAEHQLVSGLNGNFYSVDPIPFPAVAYVSACPDTQPMAIYADHGDCNSCHDATDPITFAP